MAVAQESVCETDFRILLIGRTGHGKSSTGNTIVGDEIFKVSASSKSLTKTCQWSKKVHRLGKVIEVVDTPGIFDTNMSHQEVHKELLKALALTTPGFHVIAFVLMKGRFTEELEKTQELFYNWFGRGVEKFSCVILTDTDNDHEKDVYINEDPHEKLDQLITSCGGRVVALNNKASDAIREHQVRKLFRTFDSIKTINKTMHFTNIVFQLAESYVKNKCPKKLSSDSILILKRTALKTKMSENQISCLSKVIEGSTENKNVHTERQNMTSTETNLDRPNLEQNTETDIKLLYERREESCDNKVGNLVIIDNSTNERIPNKKKIPIMKVSKSTESRHTSSELQRSQRNQEPGENNDCPRRQSLCTFGNSQSEIIKAERINDSDSLLNDHTEITSDSIVPTVTTIDEFKERVNNEEHSKGILDGLIDYLSKAWGYCKRVFSFVKNMFF